MLRRVREKHDVEEETKSTSTIASITVTELTIAEKEIIKHIQHQSFLEEISVLQKQESKGSSGNSVKKSSNVHQLDTCNHKK